MNNENNSQEENNNNQNDENNNEEEDDRLSYTLITLGLENLIHIFEENNITFIDLLLLSKEDLIELQLEMFQRNRIFHFSKLFSKYAKNYSINEISDFFTFNKQFIFNSSIYDKVHEENIEEGEYQNTGTFLINNNFKYDNNNYVKKDNINLNDDYEKEEFPEKLNIKKKEIYKPNFNNKNNKLGYYNDKKSKGKTKEKKNPNINEKKNKNDNISNINSFNNLKLKTHLVFSNKKTSKSNKAFKKYLEIQQESDSVLEKLNKQKKDSEIIKNKYQNLLNKSKNSKPSKISRMIKELKNSLNEEMNDYEEEESKNNIIENNNNNKGNINEEYEKMIDRIEEIETNQMNNNCLEYFNQIKIMVNEKGINITLKDINDVNKKLDDLSKIMNQKENLQKKSKNNINKIHDNKNKINDLDENDEFNNDDFINNIDEVEELDDEYNLGSYNSEKQNRKK